MISPDAVQDLLTGSCLLLLSVSGVAAVRFARSGPPWALPVGIGSALLAIGLGLLRSVVPADPGPIWLAAAALCLAGTLAIGLPLLLGARSLLARDKREAAVKSEQERSDHATIRRIALVTDEENAAEDRASEDRIRSFSGRVGHGDGATA